MASKKRPSRRSIPNPRLWRRLSTFLTRLVLLATFVGAVVLGLYAVYLDRDVQREFEGKRWSVPARVFARPLELFAGLPLARERVVAELMRLNYSPSGGLAEPGTYALAGNTLRVRTRGFQFAEGPQAAVTATLGFAADRVASLTAGGRELGLLRLEPLEIGGIYPAHNEDRVLVRTIELPDLFVNTLLTIEDRGFYSHYGVDPASIARAVWANLKSGRVSQGGSTLTQQLVKNFFLTPERSLVRKAKEALMAVLLERRYTKQEILEAYLNEVYLGQDGKRAIHGIGRASLYYFGVPISQVDLPRAALLVTLLRGASYYNPRRHPERALERRNRIIDTLAERRLVSAEEAVRAQRAPLGVVASTRASADRYPAFFDLVRRQLRRDYQDEDLRSEGLRIFTTLDPRVQGEAEAALAARLPALEKARKLPAGMLQGALVVTRAEGGEVLAVAGDRSPRYAGFNRALDAVRPIGSLVKPAVYLAAFERGYHLAAPLDDRAFSLTLEDGTTWAPGNYDRKEHGTVPLITALANSYNLATARLGMQLGLPRTVDMLERLGVARKIRAYPSLLLGALEMAPLEVAQFWQTLAGNGFYTPLRAIREVVTPDGGRLQRYPLTVEQRVAPAAVAQLQRALQEVVASGTARSVGATLAKRGVAGKTGTTDDLRDSWFAGYSGEHLAVAWLGRDDNKPTGLTGASGALTVWRQLMEGIETSPLQPPSVEGLIDAWVELEPFRASAPGCPGALWLPLPAEAVPTNASDCPAARDAGDGRRGSLVDWIKGLVN